MQFRFIDRQNDLAYLNNKYSDDQFQFIIIHGRRRVGKTALIKQFISGKFGVYTIADTATRKTLLDRLYESVSYQLEGRKLMFRDLGEFFNYIYDHALQKKIVLVFDEFQYLMEGVPEFTSVLQRFIDEKFHETDLFLILCGSELRTMQSLLSAQNPLYGRRTGQWKVEPFRFPIVSQFFPSCSISELIQIYSFLGGIPMYLNQYKVSECFVDNLQHIVLEKGSLLGEEPLFLLRQEFREVPRYYGILLAIASGKNRIVEIANAIGIEARTLPKYISNLLETDLIERYAPIGIISNKISRYRFKDNFLSFWFKFISPNQNLVQIDDIKTLQEFIARNYNEYIGKIFEEIVKQLIEDLNKMDLLPVKILKIGSWWKKNIEIDLIGIPITGNEIICIEIKYQQKINGSSVMNLLLKKLRKSMWHEKIIYAGVIALGFNQPCSGCIDIQTLWQSYLHSTKLILMKVQ